MTIGWVANLSLLFTELPLLERPAAAAAEGFEEVELWWPWDGDPRPAGHLHLGLAIIKPQLQDLLLPLPQIPEGVA